MIVNTILSAGGNQEPLINHKLNKSGPVKHLFARAGQPHISGDGVYAFDMVHAEFSLAELREIEDRLNNE